MLGDIVIYGAVLSGIWALIASGFTLIYGVAHIVNLAHGVFYALGAYLLYSLTTSSGLPPSVCIIPAVLIVALIGLFVYRLCIRPIAHLHGPTIILTFVLIITFAELIRLIYGSAPIHVPSIILGSISLFGTKVVTQQLLVLFSSLGIIFGLWMFIQRTDTGKAMRAVAQDREAAALMGINVERTFLTVFGISTLLAALAGALIVTLRSASPLTVWEPIMPMFAVAIFAGLGSFRGAILAAFILGYTETIIEFTVGSQFKGIIPLIIVLLILQFRPQGLFGKAIRV